MSMLEGLSSGARSGELRPSSFADLLRSVPGRARQALGVRGVAWAAGALLVGVACIILAIAAIAVSLRNSDVEQQRRHATEILELDASNRLLMRALLGVSSYSRIDPAGGELSLTESWEDFASSFTRVCEIYGNGPQNSERLRDICRDRTKLLADIGPQIQALQSSRRPIDPASLRELLAVRNTINALSVRVAREADALVDRLAGDYRSALLILVASTAGFVGAGLVLLLLVGRASMQHYEQSLKAGESAELLRETLDALPAGVVLYDANERLLMFNEVAADLTPGLREGNPIGRTYAEMARESGRRLEAAGYGPQPVEEWIERFRSKRAHRTRQAGDGRWFEWSEQLTPGGRTVGLRVDVSEVERARADYALLVDSLSDVVFKVDVRKGTFIFASAAAKDLVGGRAPDLVGKPILDFIAREDHDAMIASARAALRAPDQPLHVVQCRMMRADGQYHHVEVRFRLASVDGSEVLTGVICDIDERVRLARQLDDKMAELEGARARYQTLVDSLSDMVYAFDDKGIFTYASPGAAELLGVPSSTLIGTRFRDWVAPDDVKLVMEAGRAFHQAPNVEMRQLRFRMRAADGTIKPVELRYRKPVGESRGAAQVGVIRDISELERARAEYQTLVDSLSDVVYKLDVKTGRFTFMNAVAEQWFGMPAGQMVGRHFLEVTAPESRERVHRSTTRDYDPNDRDTLSQFSMLTKGGVVRHVELRARRYLDAQGDVVSNGIIRDIEERFQLEQRLEQQNAELQLARAEYQTLVDSLSDIVYKLDVETGRITFANAAAAQFFGEPLEQVVGSNYAERLDPEARAALEANVKHEFHNTGKTIQARFRMWAAGGQLRHVEVRYRRHLDGHGKVIVSGVLRDIEDTVRMERRIAEQVKALERARTEYQTLVDSLGDIVYKIDVETGRITFANAAAVQFFGVPMEQIVGTSFVDRIDPEFRAMVADGVNREFKNSGRSMLARFRMRAAGDAMRHVEVRYRRVIDERGRLIVSGVMRDIEEQVQLERRLERERARLRSVVESSGALIVLADRDLNVVMVNSGFTAMTGISPGEAIGRPLRDVLECPIDAALDQQQQFAIKLKAQDRTRLLALTATPVVDSEGRMSNIVLLGVDETGRREAEAALHDVERFATVGEMAATMAHELSQPLQVINIACASANDELAYPADEDKGPDLEFMKARLQRIEQQVEAASRIVGDLRAFVRGANTPENVGLFDPGRSIESAIGLTGYGVRQAGVELRVRPLAGLPKIAGESGRLEQVMVNLINNARDAGGRAIDIAAEPIEQDGKRLVRITVDDTGPGIPVEVMPRLFVSFVTTKAKGKGTGLGLRICRRIVEEMGGTISAANRDEGGARIEVVLPAAALTS